MYLGKILIITFVLSFSSCISTKNITGTYSSSYSRLFIKDDGTFRLMTKTGVNTFYSDGRWSLEKSILYLIEDKISNEITINYEYKYDSYSKFLTVRIIDKSSDSTSIYFSKVYFNDHEEPIRDTDSEPGVFRRLGNEIKKIKISHSEWEFSPPKPKKKANHLTLTWNDNHHPRVIVPKKWVVKKNELFTLGSDSLNFREFKKIKKIKKINSPSSSKSSKNK